MQQIRSHASSVKRHGALSISSNQTTASSVQLSMASALIGSLDTDTGRYSRCHQLWLLGGKETSEQVTPAVRRADICPACVMQNQKNCTYEKRLVSSRESQ